MKLNSHNLRSSWVPATSENGPAPCAGAVSAQRGIALVITLIMLSVTLVMAVAFLALERRERNSVSTATDTTNAKLAADSALAAAQAQIMANVLATNVGTYNFGLLISTNYINTNGFDPVLGSNPLNVNYSHLYGNFNPVVGADLVQNIANLQYLPRVPVFIQTNDLGSNDFRFYLDLNRNGAFDDTAYVDNSFTNGPTSETGDPQWVGILARPDVAHSANNQFVARYAFIALPVGNTLDINAIHNQTLNPDNPNLNLAADGFYRNESVGSWEINLAAFLADLNSDEWDPSFSPYLYRESANPPNNNSGAAFEDAFSIVTNRYASYYATLAVPPIARTIIPVGTNISLYDSLVNNGIDGYTAGNLMTGTQLPFVNGPGNTTPWAGSDNTNRFYDLPSDLFSTNDSSINFVKHLTLAGNSIATNYDRYTFYHLLAQLGTDSDPDDGKMNLNYRNIANGVVVPGMETNCIVWSPLEFFTNAADRMLRLYTTNWFYANPSNYLASYYNITGNYSFYYYDAHNNLVTYNPNGFGLTNSSFTPFLGWTNIVPAFGITNIPVYVNGQFVYSSAVNRVLQMAANLYDASTTNFFPSVFRPVFQMDQFTNLFIVGYSEVTNVLTSNPSTDFNFSLPYDVSQLGNLLKSGTVFANKPFGTNIYGVPWIIGAKKNLPAFNQFTMLNTVQVIRKLQVSRKVVDGPIITNHLYELSISNLIGASFWNSYSNNYVSPVNAANGVSVILSDFLQMTLNSSNAPGVYTNLVLNNGFLFNTNFWPGSRWTHKISELPANNSFIATTWTNTLFSSFVYKTGARVFTSLATDPDPWESNNASCDPLPDFELTTTNWLRAIIVDNGHVIDYVQLRGPIDGTNFTAALADPNNAPQPALWSTNAAGSGPTPSWGYVSQIDVSGGIFAAPASAVWSPVGYPAGLNTVAAAQAYFKAFFTPTHDFTYNGVVYNSTDLVLQAGYTATRTIFVPYLYQVNDPMVHYLANDLDAGAGAVWDGNAAIPNGVWQQNNGVGGVGGVQASYQPPNPPYGADIKKGRYQPWGIAPPSPALQNVNYNFGNPYNPIYKDPGVWDPDYWNFPTNRYPTVGWIGRVHRGSPWQTVYLKATDVIGVIVSGNANGTNTWAAWTGDRSLYDAANSTPVQDRLLFDLFTTRANDNAARGTLSVNQTNWAAWSAIFSGMVVLSNTTVLPPVALSGNVPIPLPTTTYNPIQPVAVDGFNTGLANLVAAINAQRASTNAVPILGFVNADGVRGAFEHVGDILSTPALTVQSPFLNWTNNASQQDYGISDAEYEWLPQQMMGLVRASPTPRYVIYGYGQALRPAANGLVTSGGINFGLVTNYQVVAESAVRAVVSVQAQLNTSGAYPVTNYTTRVESYNVLPSQ